MMTILLQYIPIIMSTEDVSVGKFVFYGIIFSVIGALLVLSAYIFNRFNVE